MYAYLRICLVVFIAGYPILVRHQLEDLKVWYVTPFLLAAGLLAFVEYRYDREKEAQSKKDLTEARAKLEETQHRIEHLRERGLSMAHLMSRVLPTMLKIEKAVEGVRDQVEEKDENKKRERASAEETRQFVGQSLALSDEVMIELLKAVAEEVRAYWSLPADSVNSNLMVAHRVQECGPTELARLKEVRGLKGREFLEFRREPESYQYMLELVFWGTPDPEVPVLVLPVEGPDPRDASDSWRDHLIPGAPTALARHGDVVVDNTTEIQKDTPPKLEQHVKDNIVKYFQDKSVRSFMCMVLVDGKEPIGVLNIESKSPEICGPAHSEVNNITRSIDHYRFCLVQLIQGQRRLRALKV